MQVVVCGTAAQQAEWFGQSEQRAEVAWVFEKDPLANYGPADVIVDLLYENTPAHKQLLRQLPGLKIINSVVDTCAETDGSFVRINGWPTFLRGTIIEAAAGHEDLKKLAEAAFDMLGKRIAWLPDGPGFVVPRVVSLIVNEAYFALAEAVSSRAEIDTAMKLGTAYPFGPFEWSEKIGLKNIVSLLQKLSSTQPRYTPAPSLLAEAQGYRTS